jgi:hypothetical protein
MTAMPRRRDPRSLGTVEGSEGRRARSFVCRDDLYEAFTRRANELECGVDWLVAEAMKRLLADGALKVAPRSLPPPMPLPSVPPSPLSRRAPLVPPPPPPRSRRTTGSFVGEKAAVGEALALRLGDQRVVVDHDRFVLGRSARDAHFALRDGGVSRQHAIVERVPGGWVIVDMASTNGIHVNGMRVTRAPIRAGDVLDIGPFTIAVERA